MVGKASSRLQMLETMPVGFSEGQKRMVTQPAQLWGRSCDSAEGNDGGGGMLTKKTQAGNHTSTMEDKNQHLEWVWQLEAWIWGEQINKKQKRINLNTTSHKISVKCESIGPTIGQKAEVEQQWKMVDHTQNYKSL